MNLRRAGGFSLVEVIASLAIVGFVLAALAGVAGQATRARESIDAAVELEQQAQFAMERILQTAGVTERVLAPRGENAGTAHSESVRDVLALSLDPAFDRDGDGFADADNDRDGRIDEDPNADLGVDGAPGIAGIDDDGDGGIDEGGLADDDEDGTANEDPLNGLDDDGDGLVDEDVGDDVNSDGKPGVIGVDDDGDLFVDEGANEDDDEDGPKDEDWLDTVVYRLSGTTLLERTPDLDPADGTDYTERPIADGVTAFRVEYIPPAAAGQPALLDVTLSLAGPDDATATLNTRVRIGGGP